MGTSTSSSGGKAGSPFDPEWLDQGDGSATGTGPGDDATDAGDSEGVPDGQDGNAETAQECDVAPDRRFMPARAKLGKYLSGGGRDALRGAASSMINKGMGGSARAARTMGGAAQGAGRLGEFLGAVRDGATQQAIDWRQRVRGQNLSAADLALELIKEVLPDTGSMDEESLRNAASDALGQLYELDPNVDIFSLTDEQIASVIGFTIGNEVCNRMDEQLGQAYEKLKYSPVQVQELRNDIREWVQGEVERIMEGLAGLRLDCQTLAQTVLTSALEVFAE
ncbi:Qat anti-phage system associated protein QatB [Pseudomonas sp. LAM2023]|uniref:Qat anti-phage system associated protein QatB n=1 Tax=Pseudomonas sp. LAM2023 TaxID=2800477 RepID=UPI00190E3EA0|nr:Qat anti-phage system associated protein QatB [Pseudomonas sp. LAM2023]